MSGRDEKGREGREGRREGGREGGRERGRQGGKERGREGGREGRREGGREGGREGRREETHAHLVNFERYPSSRDDDILDAVYVLKDPLVSRVVGTSISQEHTVQAVHEIVTGEMNVNRHQSIAVLDYRTLHVYTHINIHTYMYTLKHTVIHTCILYYTKLHLIWLIVMMIFALMLVDVQSIEIESENSLCMVE